MDPRRAQTERNMLPQVGPSFFRDGDTVMFQFVIDPGNVLGPRPARRGDQVSYAGAWAAFIAADGVSALDRDASGGDGGSLPSESPDVVAIPSFRPGDVIPAGKIADIRVAPTSDEESVFVSDQGVWRADVREDGAAVLREPAEPPRQKRKYTRRAKE